MVNKKILLVSVSIILFMSVVLIGCTQNQGGEDEGTDPSEGLMVTTSTSILYDIVQNIVGDRGSVDYMVPIGEEPEEYEPVPSDFQRLSDSDVFLVHGLNLEGWLEEVTGNVSDTPVIEVSEGVTPIPLVEEEVDDPHAWLNPKNVNIYVNNILEHLIEADPEGEREYTENAEAYLDELQALDDQINEQMEQVPEEDRVIVTSENAFQYFGEAYGFETEGIWELNAHEEGTPQQISRVVDLVNERDIPALFLETTVDERYMQTVSRETGVDIAGNVYTDAIGEEGSEADSYIDMMKHNVEVFVKGLS